MKFRICNNRVAAVIGTFGLLVMTVLAAPMEPDDETSENMLVSHSEANDIDLGGWDAVDMAALRRLLQQLDAEERVDIGSRVSRAWPQPDPRGWNLRQGRALETRARQYHNIKRQGRFRQCYFNPISCFRK